jgi:hypothetical protein
MLNDILPADDFTDSLYQDSLEIESSLPNFSTDDSLSSFGHDSRLSLTAQDALKTSQLVAAPQVGRVLTSRLQYAMDKIMTAPSQMVSMNQMPWCHAHLYDEGMPRSMQRMSAFHYSFSSSQKRQMPSHPLHYTQPKITLTQG